MEIIGNHARVWQYDGAYKCLDCQAQWGALPGHPKMPENCVYTTEAPPRPARLHADTFPFPREVEHWRERALKAEARLAELEAASKD